MTDKQLRARIMQNAYNVLIHKTGLVNVYGIMPNTNRLGWYFAGHKDDLKREYTYEMEAQ